LRYKNYILYLLPFFLLQTCTAKNPKQNIPSQVSIRSPAVAGQFYSANPSKLTKALNVFFEDAVDPIVEKPVVIIAPHAGYIYSGQIAADAYNQVRNYQYDVIVILGTNHTTAGFNDISIYPGGGYSTPLGLAEIDEDIAKSLIEEDKRYTFYQRIHTNEHSVEVQIPFIQHIFPGAKIVPVVIGKPDLDLCINFGRTLARVLKKRQALIVASSDLSHYPDYENAIEVDKKTIETIIELDPSKVFSTARNQLYRNIPNLSTCACGEAPILAAIEAAKELGATCGTIISYANSGDVAIGDRNRVVGYGAIALTKNENCESNEVFPESHSGEESFFLEDSYKKVLLDFARKSISQFLTTETVPLARGFEPQLQHKMGAFVTLKIGHELRGCIGHMSNDLPICDVVGSMALQAAFNDRRFPPVSINEMENIEIEISILTPYKPVDKVENIILGKDGVVLKKDNHQAVFLPQVAAEQGWNRDELLNHLCQKAGLSEGCWQTNAQLYTFQANVFQESDIE